MELLSGAFLGARRAPMVGSAVGGFGKREMDMLSMHAEIHTKTAAGTDTGKERKIT